MIFTKAYYTGKVKLTRIPKNAAPWDPSSIIAKEPLKIRFWNYKGEWDYEVNNPVYVFFKLRNTDREKWEDGKLSINYFFRSDWEKCGPSEAC